jgi:ribosome-binding protein aMBF1 (putative translation factor)
MGVRLVGPGTVRVITPPRGLRLLIARIKARWLTAELRSLGRMTEPELPAPQRVRSEPNGFWEVIVDHARNTQAQHQPQSQTPQTPENHRNMRPAASYVRQGRSRNSGPYVQASAAMLMATNAAKGRRVRRIALGIRLYREDAGLTQLELGKRSNMPRERVVEYENQVHEPGPDKLEAFAEALGVEVWEFEARGARTEREQQ